MYKEYVGNLHIHSKYSDGTATVEEIAAAARRAGLDFIGINDHFNLKGLHEGKEGWHDGVAVLIGCELNEKYNHFLAYDIAQEIPSDTANPQNVIDATRRQGGIGFIAHPFEKGSPLHDGGHAFIWNRWDVYGYTGISIWNFSSVWKGNARSLLSGLYYYYNIRAANLDPLDETLAKWDELSGTRKVTAIGGSDNHGLTIKAFLGLVRGRVFDYEYAFRAVNTHVLLRDEMPADFNAAKRAIYDALKAGCCFVACGLFADPRGFRFEAETRSGTTAMGEQVFLEDLPNLVVNTPSRGLIRFIHNGQVIMSKTGKQASLRIGQPGPYRAEVRLPRAFGRTRAWILSNPIYAVRRSVAVLNEETGMTASSTMPLTATPARRA
ncbi:MAG: CehA/McbA family metallohydrolase [Candidatus Hydrogenedentota bacterium]|nr:MAG: CehA/McbA family metallohydrolase [Candidatus Hydrogenedentota bacterium]